MSHDDDDDDEYSTYTNISSSDRRSLVHMHLETKFREILWDLKGS